ncbi:P-loop containing nucleoside triphosphate hydrolase protein [Pluteus cervinus]|uniref:P-loop containing nucleoside triphosphate hydrolase protein n=1 Tax=Pluteus cervinus TaxID=181527 RepID=A0ACD3AFD6_9AGAR|nr:P-loop containing nucleoside triphosphate hydrolase protein [Pluteus cervinus]
MPAPSYSTLVAALLMAQWGESGQDKRLWNDPVIMRRIGFSCTPTSTDIPRGLSPEQANSLDVLFTRVKKLSWDVLLTSLPNEDAFKSAWGPVFSARLSSGLNDRIDQILDDLGAHPQQNTDGLDFPDTTQLVNMAGDTVALEIFGPSIRKGKLLHKDASAGVRSILFHRYNAHCRRFKHAKINHQKRKAELEEVMKNIEGETTISVDLFQEAMKKTIEFRKSILWFPGEKKTLEAKVATMQEILRNSGQEIPEDNHIEDVIGDLDDMDDIDDATTTEKPARRSSDICLVATTPEYVTQQLAASFIDYFRRSPDPEEIMLRDQTLDNAIALDTEDLGVAEMSKCSTESLSTQLGFPNAKPPNWADYRHKDTKINPHNSPELFKSAEGSPEFSQICLMWHQLVGVASMVQHAFTAAKRKSNPGILLADGVGVGKTAQVMGFIAFLQLALKLWQGVNAPPIIKDKPFFMGQNGIPDGSHLIIAPLSLIDQWKRELQAVSEPEKIYIVTLTSNRRSINKVFRPGGTWFQNPQKAINKICLVPLSTFQTMAAARFNCRQPRKFAEDAPRANADFTGHDIFDIQWLTVWLEEAHDYRRSTTRQFVGAAALRSTATFMACVTATPLYTSPKDVINLGRLLSIEPFLKDAGVQLEQLGLRKIARAKALLSREDRQEIQHRQEAQLQGQEPNGANPAAAVEAVEVQFIQSIQKSYGKCIIRRGPESYREDGKKINEDLPQYVMNTLPITLPAAEMTQLKANMDKQESEKRKGLHAFFSVSRIAIGFPGASKGNFPHFRTKEDWEKSPGGKLAFTIKLLQHCLRHDKAPPPTVNSDGDVEFPGLPESPSGSESATPERKILMYHEFPMMAHTIASALEVNGIKCYVVNGSMTITERNQTLRKYVDNVDPSVRVLLLSSVGITGLNLACASIVIFYDQVWSAVTAAQVIGRAYRFGQRLEVQVYNILALGTSDVIMTSMAGSKGKMLEGLLTKSRDEYMESVLGSKRGEDEDIDNTSAVPKSRPKKATSKKSNFASSSKQSTPSSASSLKKARSQPTKPQTGGGHGSVEPSAAEEDTHTSSASSTVTDNRLLGVPSASASDVAAAFPLGGEGVVANPTHSTVASLVVTPAEASLGEHSSEGGTGSSEIQQSYHGGQLGSMTKGLSPLLTEPLEYTPSMNSPATAGTSPPRTPYSPSFSHETRGSPIPPTNDFEDTPAPTPSLLFQSQDGSMEEGGSLGNEQGPVYPQQPPLSPRVEEAFQRMVASDRPPLPSLSEQIITPELFEASPLQEEGGLPSLYDMDFDEVIDRTPGVSDLMAGQREKRPRTPTPPKKKSGGRMGRSPMLELEDPIADIGDLKPVAKRQKGRPS